MTTQAEKIARHNALTDALRVGAAALGEINEDAADHPAATAIFEAIKRLRDGEPAIAANLDRVDYLDRVQHAARTAYRVAHGILPAEFGVAVDATASVETPLGRLKLTTWEREVFGKRGRRRQWAGEYSLDEAPITVAEIRAANLAPRPTTRKRRNAT